MSGFSNIQNLQHLRALILLYRHGSLRNAALETGTSIPTLRRHIDALENDIGAPLVSKSQTRVDFTIEGRKLLEGALRIERELTEVESIVSAGRQTCRGEVALAAVCGTGTEWLIPHLQRFAISQPEVQVKLTITPFEFSGDYDEFDIVIQVGRPSSDLRVNKRVAKYTCGFYGAAALIERFGCPANVDELAALPHVGAEWQRGEASSLDRVFAGHQAPDKPIFFTNDCSAQINAVIAGLGWTVISHRWARKHSTLVRLLPDIEMIESELWISAGRSFHKVARIKALYDFLVCCFECDSDLFLPMETGRTLTKRRHDVQGEVPPRTGWEQAPMEADVDESA